MGVGGEPGQPGENCVPQGNVLIIQDGRTDKPSDNGFGGSIEFCFDIPAPKYIPSASWTLTVLRW